MKATPLRHERGVLRDNRQAAEVPSRCLWSRTPVRVPRLALFQSASGIPCGYQAVAARRAAFGADCVALTAVLVTA